MEERVLEKLNNISDVKKLNLSEMESLADELRTNIIDVTFRNGGHLSASLGAVDAIVALSHVYDFTKDKIIFDVGHQSYAYKILARGRENFQTLRTIDGESGYPDGKSGDNFIGGHAGNSLSASLGIAVARDFLKEDYHVVTFVGDASFFNGENLEALFVNDKKPSNFIVIFNDNGMSISKNENGMYKFFSKMALRKSYRKTKNFFKKLFGKNFIGRGLKKMKFAFKRTLTPAAALEVAGLKYYGVFDGHDIKTLCSVIEEVKERGRPAFIHIRTKKGKGYEPAEESAEKFHGISRGFVSSRNSFSESISPLLSTFFEEDDRLVAITAGMKRGTGLTDLDKRFPERVFDVGISEEHAVTFAGGLAIAGLKPIVLIYSTFLQRAYDQIISDVCMQKLPVVFLIDRAGFVGSDGRTHQGLFDITYLRSIPEITLLAPKDIDELRLMLKFSFLEEKPIAIRYPNGDNRPIEGLLPFKSPGKWEEIRQGKDVFVLAEGPRMINIALRVAKEFDGDVVSVVNARSIKPLDEKYLKKLSGKKIITMEENVISGGFGESVSGYFQKNNMHGTVVGMMGVSDCFVEHGTIESQLEKCGLTESRLKELIEELIEEK